MPLILHATAPHHWPPSFVAGGGVHCKDYAHAQPDSCQAERAEPEPGVAAKPVSKILPGQSHSSRADEAKSMALSVGGHSPPLTGCKQAQATRVGVGKVLCAP